MRQKLTFALSACAVLASSCWTPMGNSDITTGQRRQVYNTQTGNTTWVNEACCNVGTYKAPLKDYDSGKMYFPTSNQGYYLDSDGNLYHSY